MAADNYRVAKQFGFIPSYPSGAGAQGPEPEPWEYVYVGVKAIDCSPHLFRDNDRPAFDTCVNPPPTTWPGEGDAALKAPARGWEAAG